MSRFGFRFGRSSCPILEIMKNLLEALAEVPDVIRAAARVARATIDDFIDMPWVFSSSNQARSTRDVSATAAQPGGRSTAMPEQVPKTASASSLAGKKSVSSSVLCCLLMGSFAFCRTNWPLVNNRSLELVKCREVRSRQLEKMTTNEPPCLLQAALARTRTTPSGT